MLILVAKNNLVLLNWLTHLQPVPKNGFLFLPRVVIQQYMAMFYKKESLFAELLDSLATSAPEVVVPMDLA